MGKVAKQSIQTTVFSYLGVVIGYFNVLWLYPYALDASQLGTFRTIQDLGLLFVPFAQLGVGHGITRYFPQLKSNQSAFLSYGLAISLLGFAVVSILFFGFKTQIIGAFAVNSPEVIDFLGVVLLITLFALLSSVLDAYSRSYVKVAVPTLIREVFLRLLTSILVGLYLLDWIAFDQVMIGLALVYGFALLGVLVYLYWLGVLRFRLDWGALPSGLRGSFVKFSLITFLATAASTLIMKIDSIMVSSMVSLEANAIYTIAFSMALVVELPRRAISQVVMPVIAENFQKNELPAINLLYKQVSNRQLYICLLLFIGIWSNIDVVYQFIPNQEIYESGKWVVFLIGIGKLFDVMFSVNGEILVFSKHYKFNLTATIGMSILIILLNFLFIPIYGIIGAALASALVMLLFNLTKFIYLRIKLGFSPFSGETIRILGVGVVAFSVGIILGYLNLSEIHPLLNLLITSACILISYLLASVLFGAGKEEWNWIREKIIKSGP